MQLLLARERAMNIPTMTTRKRTTLIAYTDRIAETCAGIWQENCILAGVTRTGTFLMRETADYSAHFAADDLAEQCTFRAGSTAQKIKARIEFWERMY